MNIKRCPWCGKKINYPRDHRRIVQKNIPRYFKFAQCSHCDNYYGQDVRSREVKICFLISLILLIAGVIVGNIYIIFPAIIVLWISLLTPLKKMNKDETKICYSNCSFKFLVIEGVNKLKPNKLYFLDDKFDQYGSFTTISPIIINRINRKSKEIFAFFIYDHPYNTEYLKKDIIKIYNNKMIMVAKIVCAQQS